MQKKEEEGKMMKSLIILHSIILRYFESLSSCLGASV